MIELPFEAPRIAISVRQPWAWLIVVGAKDIENRTWKTNVRGPVLIHAAKTFNKEDRDYAENFREYHEGIPENKDFVLGAIIGQAEIVNCVTSSSSKWFNGPFGFVLTNQKLYSKPIPYRGSLGFFKVQ